MIFAGNCCRKAVSVVLVVLMLIPQNVLSSNGGPASLKGEVTPENALETYQQAYQSNQDEWIQATHFLVEKNLTPEQIQSIPELKEYFDHTKWYLSHYELAKQIVADTLASHDRFVSQDEMLADISSKQCIPAPDQMKGMTFENVTLVQSILSILRNHIPLKSDEPISLTGFPMSDFHLGELLYEKSLTHAVKAHADVREMAMPKIPPKDWKKQLRLELMSTYCSSNRSGENLQPLPDQDMIVLGSGILSCEQIVDRAVQNNSLRPWLNIEEIAKTLNYHINDANNALDAVRKKLPLVITEDDPAYERYAFAWQAMFASKPGVLLLSDALKGYQPVDFSNQFGESIGGTLQGYGAWIRLMKIIGRELLGISDLDTLRKDQEEAVKPQFTVKQIMNPTVYVPELILFHNYIDPHNSKDYKRLELAIEQTTAEISSGIRTIQKTEYKLDHGVVNAMKDMIEFYPTAALDVMLKFPQYALRILQLATERQLEIHVEHRRQRVIAPVMLVIGGVLMVGGFFFPPIAAMGAALSTIGLVQDTISAFENYSRYKKYKAAVWSGLSQQFDKPAQAYQEFVISTVFACLGGLMVLGDFEAMGKFARNPSVFNTGASLMGMDDVGGIISDELRIIGTMEKPLAQCSH